MKKIKIYTDGGSRGNPGKAASAFIAVDEGKIVHSKSKYLGTKTNNEAEYNAIIMALSWALKNEKRYIEIVSDSELVIKQINKVYRINKPHLKALNETVNQLTKGKNISFSNQRREDKFISMADYLVNKELDKN